MLDYANYWISRNITIHQNMSVLVIGVIIYTIYNITIISDKKSVKLLLIYLDITAGHCVFYIFCLVQVILYGFHLKWKINNYKNMDDFPCIFVLLKCLVNYIL